MTLKRSDAVELVAVDDAVLDALVKVAVEDASADDVTPPLTADGSWSDERVAWLRAYHRDRRAGLAGPYRERTWAVRAGGTIVGAVRLAAGPTGDAAAELGIWLARSTRGRGVGAEAVRLLIGEASASGVAALSASTRESNQAALRILRSAGFATDQPGPDGAVEARRAPARTERA
ncbi:GNAT family N-acetyltransferase [Amycolatopsis thailandensis]|uniref:GNAT family N-acetyltransferase n=1 Tax=Amycolatopsis thailandensis TaxID=589330 RepID=UPI003639E6E3